MFSKSIILLLIVTICAGSCKKCPDMCLMIYKPVCARLKVFNVECTFGNSCQLDILICRRPHDGWRKVYDGSCRKDSRECKELLKRK